MREILKFMFLIAAFLSIPPAINAQSWIDKPVFKNINIGSNDTISWTVEKDADSAVYILEEYRWERWIKIAEVPSKGNGENEYTCKNDTICDLYNIRIRLKSDRNIHSRLVQHKEQRAVTFRQGLKDGVLEMSCVTRYEVLDAYSNRVRSGCSEKILVSKLKRGIYYVNYGNEMSKFIKK